MPPSHLTQRYRLGPGVRLLGAQSDPARVVIFNGQAFDFDSPAAVAVLDRASASSGLDPTSLSQAELAVLRELLEEKILTPISTDIDESEAATWHRLAQQPPSAIHLSVRYLGVPELPELRGNQARRSPHALALTVICTDDYLRPEVETAIASDHPTLLARPAGSQTLIGPLLVPGHAICYHCLAAWLRLRRWRQASLTNWTNGAWPPEPAIEATLGTRTASAGLILTTIDRFRLQNGRLADLEQAIRVFDPWTGQSTRAPLLPSLGCANCGPESKLIPVVDRVAALANPIAGLAETIKTAASRAPALHFASARTFAPLPADPGLGILRPTSAAGRGRDHAEALRTTFFEAAERYSLFYDGTETLLWGTAAELAPAFAWEQWLQLSRRQQAGGPAPGTAGRPPQPAERLAWVAGRSLTTGEKRLVPAAGVFLNYRASATERVYIEPDGSGTAAGASLEQAASHALLELLERDALAIWWYNQIALPAIEAESVDDSNLRQTARLLESAGRTLSLFDLTNDLGVPVVAAISADREGKAIYLGAAADLDPHQAARRAAEELLQFWFWDQAQAGPPETRAEWLRRASFDTHSFLRCSHRALLSRTRSGPAADPVAALRAAGLDAILVDCTRPMLGIPVARLLAPGLRSVQRRLGPGRLYDVPVKLGWRKEPTPEDRMNSFTPPL